MKTLLPSLLLLTTVCFASDQATHTCKFNHGPLQGQIHTLPNQSAWLIGTSCSDGLTSSGIAVPDPDNAANSERMSHTCKFNRGPLQGQVQTLPTRDSTPVGSTCSDGLTSMGIAVPDPPDAAAPSRMSHTCKFNRGALQGQTQTLPNRNPTKIGSSCSDGLTSTGITVPDPS